MSTFYAGNDKLIAIAKQVDAETPASSPTQAWRVFNWNKDAPRAIAPLEESDSSAQEGASHVTAIVPAFSCDLYLRASEFDLIAEGLLGLNDDSATTSPATHVATATPTPVYFTVWEIDPYETVRYDGCVMVSATLQGQDEGQTEWRVTGLTFIALTLTHGVTEPAGAAALVVDELPLLWAETQVRYGGTHTKRTSAVTININRNSSRVQGDNGFQSLAVVHGKLSVDAQATRYLADDDAVRAVDTGTTAGTTPTATIYTQAFQVLATRGSGGSTRAFQIDIAEVAFETLEKQNDYGQGRPVAEVIGLRSQPQTDIATNTIVTTTNAKPTTEG